MLNPELKPGDRVVLLNMPDETGMLPGLGGIITSVHVVMGTTQYQVDWDNGSKLSLLSDTDTWMKEKNVKKKNIGEQDLGNLTRNRDVFENFNTTFLFNFLKKLRESGIVNMFGAAPYLYLGKTRIYHQEYNNPIAEDNEAYEELLGMADKAQREMINGVVRVLQNEDKETSVENINRYLNKYSNKMWEIYTYRMSNQ